MRRKAALRFLFSGEVINPVIVVKESKYRYLVEHTQWWENPSQGIKLKPYVVQKWYWKRQVTFEHE